MMTKTVRSRFNHEVGEKVEGCTILEKSIVAPPNPVEQRRGIYDYLVEVPPVTVKPRSRATVPAAESFTRSTPEEMGGPLIRRLPSR
jgi:hypothetical protein